MSKRKTSTIKKQKWIHVVCLYSVEFEFDQKWNFSSPFKAKQRQKQLAEALQYMGLGQLFAVSYRRDRLIQ